MKDVHAIRARCATAASRVIAVRRAPLARRAGNVIGAAGALLALAPALFAPALHASPAALFAAALHASPPPPPTLEKVLEKSLAARGGAQKLKAVSTRREIGTLGLGAGNEWPFVVEHKRPNLMRMEIELQGTKLIRTFDGTHGWQKQPQSPAPEQLTGDDLHNIANEADFDNVLVDTSAKGKAELLGKESIGGAAGGVGSKPAYKVQVTLKSGDLFYYYIDAASYLPVHWEGSRMINGKPVLFESDFNDYRDAGGVKYPFEIVSSIKGSVQKQKITFTKIEINPAIDDTRFTPASMAVPPASAPAPTPPAAAPPPTPPPAAAPPAATAPPPPPPASPPPAAATTPPPSPPPARRST
jgi:hypothetical protein